MNQEQRDWLEWLKRTSDGVITQRKAAELMGVTDRWVRKLLVDMEGKGDGVDFKPTFASERLAKRRGVQESKETLRKWMMAAGVANGRNARNYGPAGTFGIGTAQIARHRALPVARPSTEDHR